MIHLQSISERLAFFYVTNFQLFTAVEKETTVPAGKMDRYKISEKNGPILDSKISKLVVKKK